MIHIKIGELPFHFVQLCSALSLTFDPNLDPGQGAMQKWQLTNDGMSHLGVRFLVSQKNYVGQVW